MWLSAFLLNNGTIEFKIFHFAFLFYLSTFFFHFSSISCLLSINSYLCFNFYFLFGLSNIFFLFYYFSFFTLLRYIVYTLKFFNLFASNIISLQEMYKNLIFPFLPCQLIYSYFHIVVQSLNRVRFFATPWTVALLSSIFSQSLLKFMSTESVMLSNHLILCHPLLLLSIFPSIRVFCNELALYIRRPKYWSFSFRIGPSNEYSQLISFRLDWFDLAAQGTLKSLLQHHHLKTSILWSSAFFIAQLSHLYMTTRKTIALTIQTFVSKVMFLLSNMLSCLS